ncbi:MAG: hypothetical protein O3A66_01200, partial [Proteobacteria bacterium]|nr:hypothetical protein [Pseudomonadota bacterium]
MRGVVILMYFASCKTSTTVRSLSSSTDLTVTCSDGVTIVTSLSNCPSTTPPVIVASLPFAYRGAIGQNNNTVSLSYMGLYDAGLLHAIYDHNSTTYGTTANRTNRQDIVLMGWGVAAKQTSDNFINLKTQTIANTSSSLVCTPNVTDWIDMDSTYHPLLLGTNVEKYYVHTDISPSEYQYESTAFASLIASLSPSTANSDHDKLYTGIGFSNAKIHSQNLIDVTSNDGTYSALTTAAQMYTKFSDMATAVPNATLFVYDYHTDFLTDASKVRTALIMNPAIYNTDGSVLLNDSFLGINATNKVLVLPLGDSVNSSNGAALTVKNEKFLNNVAYVDNTPNVKYDDGTPTNYTSFAARVLAGTDYLDRAKTSITDPTKSTPVVAIPVMNYGDFTGTGDNKKLNYYIPQTSYGAGVLRNVSLSVPISYQTMVYYYDYNDGTRTKYNETGNMRAGMAGFDKNYGNTGSLLAPHRQASATLTALIASVQSAQGVVARNALRQVAYHSTPMYGKNTGSTYTATDDILTATQSVTTQTHGTGTYKEYLIPNLIIVNKSNVNNLIDAFNSSTFAANSSVDQKNTTLSTVTLSTSTDINTADTADAVTIGGQTANITSHDVIVKSGTKIIAMNDIYVGKTVVTGYDNSTGVQTTGTVAEIREISANNPAHDDDENPKYTGYYFCLANEADATCANPNRRIASNVFGFGMVNYRTFGQALALESIIRNQGASNTVSSSGEAGMVTSMAFGDAFASKELSVNIRGQNDAGETWDEVQDGRFRVTHDTVQSPFNSMLTSNAFQSQNSVKSYMFDIGGNAFSANISGRNISTTQDSATLKGTRFSDMNLEEHRARNFYGVIADTDAQAGRFSNVGYSGNLMGINFVVRSNFQPGLDIEKISGTQNNVLERASVHYNPYTALTSNQFDAQSFAMNTNISNFIKLGMATTVGKSNFGNTNIYQGIIAVDNSTNLSQTLSISHHKNGNLVGVDFGF